MSSVLPARPSEVEFEVSPDAAAVIRQRGGQLWIWPSPYKAAYATTEPPGDTHEWTDYRQAGFVVHVDDAIVPPHRWVVDLPTDKSRFLDARWNGEDPHGALGRLPLVASPDDEPTESIPWYRRALGIAALLVLVIWAVLGLAGVGGWGSADFSWRREGSAFLIAVLVGAGRWLWRRFGA